MHRARGCGILVRPWKSNSLISQLLGISTSPYPYLNAALDMLKASKDPSGFMAIWIHTVLPLIFWPTMTVGKH